MMLTFGEKDRGTKRSLEYLFKCMSALSSLFRCFLYHSCFPPYPPCCVTRIVEEVFYCTKDFIPVTFFFPLSLTWHLVMFSWSCLWCRRWMSFMSVFLLSLPTPELHVPFGVCWEFFFFVSQWMSESPTDSHRLPLWLLPKVEVYVFCEVWLTQGWMFWPPIRTHPDSVYRWGRTKV